MCGLFGAIHPPDTPIDLARARHSRDTLTHRGPDQAGEWLGAPGTYIGHRRLSIIDTSDAARQPMVDGQINITVNGEIYNYRALRRELQNAGHRFRSDSDSEVVLHGYRHWGLKQLLARLEGMYAAVIYDGERGCVHAFRDRIGIKPFYYYHSGATFVWASELKAIRAYLPWQALTADPEAVLDFLTYRYIPAPKSLYRSVAKLPAASALTYRLDDHSITTQSYWQLPDEQLDENDATLASLVLEKLQDSITSQLNSDVPLGLLLSGGMDSAVIAKFAGAEQAGMQGFSIGFTDAGRDETPIAAEMAAAAGLEHHTAAFVTDDMANVAQRLQAFFDEPFSDTSAFPTHQVCEFARQRVTVALSGDGGDELFGGYTWYERFRNFAASLEGWNWRPDTGLLLPRKIPARDHIYLSTIGDPLWLYAVIRGSLPTARLKKWKRRLGVDPDYDELWAYRAAWRPGLTARKAAQVMDFHTYLPDDILTKVDRVSMATSLECRPALLSTDTVEAAFKLPESFIYSDQQLKGGLRKTLSNKLPGAVINAAKQGFSVPDTGWRSELIARHGSPQEAFLAPYLQELDI